MEKKLLIYFLGVFLFIFSLQKLITFFPYPELLTETYFMSHGMKPYSQINDVHLPGVMLLPINLFTLGIKTVNDLRLVHAFLPSINAILIILILRRLGIESKFYLFLSQLIYLLFFFLWEGNILWIDSFVSVGSLFGFYLLLSGWYSKSYLNTCITGLFFGLVLLFKQHTIFICLTSSLWVLVTTKSIKRLMLITLSWSIPLIVTVLYVINLGVFSDFIFWTLLHNLQGYIDIGGKTPSPVSLFKLLLLLIPGIFGILFTTNKHLNKYLTLVFLAATLFFNFPRFELLHAQVALPLVVIGTLLAISGIKSSLKIITSLCLVTGSVLSIRFLTKNYKGETLFYTDTSKSTINYASKNTSPGDTIFVYGVSENIYHLSNTLPPQKNWVGLLPGNIISGVQEVIINTLAYDPPKFILLDPSSTIDNMHLFTYTPKIKEYIFSTYEHSITLDNQVQVWTPRSGNFSQ